MFWIETDGTVLAAYGLDDAAEPSGLAIHNNELWIILDHEDSDPTHPSSATTSRNNQNDAETLRLRFSLRPRRDDKKRSILTGSPGLGPAKDPAIFFDRGAR